MAKPKKKKATPEQMHRNLQDSVQALPLAIAQMVKVGKRGQAFLFKYIRGPMMRLMKRVMDRQRYRGEEGALLKQKEQMKRHLEQRQAKRQGKRR